MLEYIIKHTIKHVHSVTIVELNMEMADYTDVKLIGLVKREELGQ
jgi:hypothetical protein